MRRTSKVRVKVWGDGGLFTRPEGKVERVSYSILTPSAARGIIEAIFWKPEIKYQIRAIKVLEWPKFSSIIRNETSDKASINKSFMKNPKNKYIEDSRQLRHSLFLTKVAYIIEAEIILMPETEHPIEKYESIFNRRVSKGQCFSRPYLGTREFSCHFSPVEGNEQVIDWSEELGPMFFDYYYAQNKEIAQPYFFNAEVVNGQMTVPQSIYEEVYKECMLND